MDNLSKKFKETSVYLNIFEPTNQRDCSPVINMVKDEIRSLRIEKNLYKKKEKMQK